MMDKTEEKKADPKEYLDKRLVPRALQRLDTLLDSANETVVQKAADSVLDRAGYDRKTGPAQDNKTLVLNFDPKYLQTALEGVKKIFENKTVHDEGLDSDQ